uniref:Kinesin-like protein n=1 Tax=Ciona savignyi TaxID=51511 RepID=H2ZLU3_CIOSA
MSKSKNSECVKVVVRCRPLNQKEIEGNHESVVSMDVKTGQVQIKNPKAPLDPPKSFTFDAIYDWNCTQSDIFEETFHPLLDSVLNGFNGTIFAYGQTGTGKTFTMEGCVRSDQELRGAIPRSFEHVYKHIARTKDQQYLVRASYLEIYQEDIRDLLSKDQSKRLELKERPDTGVYVKDLLSFVTKSVKEIEHVMNVGNQNRSVGATNMNEHSSRSHAIFVITIECSEDGLDGKNHIRVGKLNLVDLAGSERQDKNMAEEERARLLQEQQAKLEELKRQHDAKEELNAKIKAMQSKLLVGGRTIMDHTNEQEKELEERKQLLAEQRRKERSMKQQLVAREESALEAQESYSSLRQEVDEKTKRLKKMFTRLQQMKADISDLHEANCREREELEISQMQMNRELKYKLLVIENFIPNDERARLEERIIYNDETDQWELKSVINTAQNKMMQRPKSAHSGNSRPTSQYAKMAAAVGFNPRYRGDNILLVDLDMPTRTTQDYEGPTIAPKVQAALDAALQEEGELQVDAICRRKTKRRVKSSRPRTAKKNVIPNGSDQPSLYPTSRGLVPK